MLNKAIKIAAKAHSGQVDKGGNPYILHPLRVLLNFCESESEATKICAILHDVVEDSDITLADLRAEGFSDEIITVGFSAVGTRTLQTKKAAFKLQDNLFLTKQKFLLQCLN